MPLLLDRDYEVLREMGLLFEEDETHRFFVFLDYVLPDNLYTVDRCDILIVVPRNYNQGGNDMFWTHPRLHRKDSRAIPQTLDEGNAANWRHGGKEFCRWSRHWNHGPSAWKSGVDDISTIQRRVEWALRNPEAKE